LAYWQNRRAVALNIDNLKIERLAAQIARATGESETEAILVALEDRRDRLGLGDADRDIAAIIKHFETNIWPKIPPDMLGKPISQEEQDEILGYSEDGF